MRMLFLVNNFYLYHFPSEHPESKLLVSVTAPFFTLSMEKMKLVTWSFITRFSWRGSSGARKYFWDYLIFDPFAPLTLLLIFHTYICSMFLVLFWLPNLFLPSFSIQGLTMPTLIIYVYSLGKLKLIYLSVPPWKCRSPSELNMQGPCFLEGLFGQALWHCHQYRRERVTHEVSHRLLCVAAGTQQQEQDWNSVFNKTQ